MRIPRSPALVTLLSVVTTYAVYALIAVPIIEPEVTRGDALADLPSPEVVERDWPSLFPEGAWELGKPKWLETDQGMLLFQDYRPTEDGRVELKPFTLVLRARVDEEESGDASEPTGDRPMIMRAPAGAILRFDAPLNFTQGKMGRLEGGRLVGDIVIYSPETSPGAGDRLEITTRNVQVDSKRVWTPHEVEFRFGQSFGSGSDLLITLQPKQPHLGKSDSTNVGGVQSLELVHVDRVHLDLAAEQAGAARPAAVDASDRAFPIDLDSSEPTLVEIACQGPFRFDFEKLIATFEQQVDVVQLHPDGVSDQLNCELLAIHFAGGAASDGAESVATQTHLASESEAATSEQELGDLQVARVVAEGHPVVLRAPSANATARGERLSMDLMTKRVYLADGRNALFEQEGRRIESPQLEYELNPEDPKRLGRLWAAGPGRFVAPQEEGSGGDFEAKWEQDLRLQPQDDAHVLSLTGDATVTAPGAGEFVADRIHVWLQEAAALNGATLPGQRQAALNEASPAGNALAAGAGGRVKIIADRMLAEGKVRIDSPELVGRTQRVEAWFRYAAPPALPLASGAPVDPSAGGPAPSVSPNAKAKANGGGAYDVPGAPAPWAMDRSEPPSQRFDVQGNLLQLQVIVGQEKYVEYITLEGDVVVRQLPMGDSEAKPLRIEGQRLHLEDIRPARVKARIVGQPARVSAEDLVAEGDTIQLSQPDNRLWIEGGGMLTLPRQSDQALRGVHRPQPVAVVWNGLMDFDGYRVRFADNVRVHALNLRDEGGADDVTVRADVLDVEMTRRLDFADPKRADQEKIDARRFLFPNRVEFENRGYSKLGAQESYDQGMARALSVDRADGRLTAAGPGWISSVRFGDNPMSAVSGTPVAAENSAAALNFTQVTFQRGVSGNINFREVEFFDQVQTIYGPVNAWDDQLDARTREGLGKDGVLLTCDSLKVADMTGGNSPAAIELVALGNTNVQGRTFSGRGWRITYAQAKDMLVFEGDGRGDAVLAYQARVGQRPGEMRAQRIQYWPKTQQVQVDGIRQIELFQGGPLFQGAGQPGATTPR